MLAKWPSTTATQGTRETGDVSRRPAPRLFLTHFKFFGGSRHRGWLQHPRKDLGLARLQGAVGQHRARFTGPSGRLTELRPRRKTAEPSPASISKVDAFTCLPCKVQQRGVQACIEVLQALMDGVVEGQQAARIHIMDLVPNRRLKQCQYQVAISSSTHLFLT